MSISFLAYIERQKKPSVFDGKYKNSGRRKYAPVLQDMDRMLRRHILSAWEKRKGFASCSPTNEIKTRGPSFL